MFVADNKTVITLVVIAIVINNQLIIRHLVKHNAL